MSVSSNWRQPFRSEISQVRRFSSEYQEEDSTFHHVYRFKDSAGSGDSAYGQRLNNQLISNPDAHAKQAGYFAGQQDRRKCQ